MSLLSTIKHSNMVNYIVRNGLVANLVMINPCCATKILFRLSQGYSLNLNEPKTLNEKLQYLKLNNYYENPTVTMVVDKFRVREYLENFGEGYKYLLNDLVGKGYYDTVDEINIDELPEQFVLKCNHDSGSVVICKDKKNFNWETEAEKLKKSLKKDYWKANAETQYKNVKKCVICEKYLEDESGNLIDYKFYCFNGVPLLLYCSAPHKHGEKLQYDFFDLNWNRLDITRMGTIHMKKTIDKPENLDEMIIIAKELSQPFPFVRVDLFCVDKRIYFSEFTLVPTAGLAKYEEPGIDLWLGSQLEL